MTKFFSLSALKSFNKFLNLIVGVAVISSVFALFDYFNQRAQVTFDVVYFPERAWIDEDAVVAYYTEHNYKIPDVVKAYLHRPFRVVFPTRSESKKIETGEFSNYPDKLPPTILSNSSSRKIHQIDDKLHLKSYSPYWTGVKGIGGLSNCDDWVDKLLPEVRKLSDSTATAVLELAILGARRINSTIFMKNEGDLIARNIRVYIRFGRDLLSGGKEQVLSITSLRPIPRVVIEDYRAEVQIPALKPKNGNRLNVITREAPIFPESVELVYDTQRKVSFVKLLNFFGIFFLVSLLIVVLFSLTRRDKLVKREHIHFPWKFE